MSTVEKTSFKQNFIRDWNRVRAWWGSMTKERNQVANELDNVSDSIEEAGEDFFDNFQAMMVTIMFTALGVLMIYYIAGYPGGVNILIANLLVQMLPGASFETVWLSFGIANYILICFFIYFVRILFSTEHDAEEIKKRIESLEKEIEDLSHASNLVGQADLLTESMASLNDKLDEIKLHL